MMDICEDWEIKDGQTVNYRSDDRWKEYVQLTPAQHEKFRKKFDYPRAYRISSCEGCHHMYYVDNPIPHSWCSTCHKESNFSLIYYIILKQLYDDLSGRTET